MFYNIKAALTLTLSRRERELDRVLVDSREKVSGIYETILFIYSC